MSLLDFFQVTRQKNTTALCVLLLISLVASTCWLFGLEWTLTLCAVSGVSYCATSYFCYHPEAGQWREALEEGYERLFERGLEYSHHPNKQRTPKNVTPDTLADTGSRRNRVSFSVNHTHTPSPGEAKTKGELSSGVSIDDARQPHPVATEKDSSTDSAATGSAQPKKKCHKEAQKLIRLIMRDFVESWYGNVTSDTEFTEDVQKILEHVALEINIRLQNVDLEETVVEILELILPYLEVLNHAGIRNYSGVELFDVNTETCERLFEGKPNVTHYALKSSVHERRHYRQALDALLQCAFPSEYASCDVACTFVRELLIKNVFEPLFDLLCNPAFLYEAIPIILKKADPEKITGQLNAIEQENEELERILNRDRLIVNITGTSSRQKRRFYTSSGRFGQSAYYTNIPSPTLSPRRHAGSGGRASGKPRPHSIASLPNMQRTSSGIYEHNSSWMTQSSQTLPRRSSNDMEETTTSYPPPTTSSKRLMSRPRTQNGTGSLYSRQNVVAECAEYPEEDYKDAEDMNSFDHVVNGEFAVVELSPIYIERHVRVDPGTGTSNPHIAYIFKFPKWMLSDDDLRELGVVESDTHLEGMKRYSEFHKFHTTLMASSLRAHLKGLTFPDKHHLSRIISKLPFTSTEHDAAVILERKQGLEKYLQSISSVDEIVSQSDLFHEFLKTGVKCLREAHVVDPKRSKKQHRTSFLGRVKGEDTSHKAEPVPKRPLESVLSSYLNTHLPLPCRQLNSPGTIRKQRRRWSDPTHEPPPQSPSIPPASPQLKASKHSWGPSSMQGEYGSTYSLLSSGSGASSHGSHSTSPRQSVTLQNLPSFQKVTENTHRMPDQRVAETGCEALDDLGAPSETMEMTGSVVSVTGSLQKGLNGMEEEEGCTIGGGNSTSVTSSANSTPVPPEPILPARPTTPPSTPPPHSSFSAAETHARTQTPTTNSDDKTTHYQDSTNKSRFQSLLYKFLLYAYRFFSWLVFIIQKGVEPYSETNLMKLVKVERDRSPLTNTLFCLGSEASVRNCPRLWVCSQNTQLAILVLAGGGMERFLWYELKTLVRSEENWIRALFTLRHTLWPQDKMRNFSGNKITEKELEDLKDKAAISLKKFLPNFMPHIVGADDYHKAVLHCLNCLGNPRLTRHFLLRVVDLLIVKIAPEVRDRHFEKHLSQLRTRQRNHYSVD